MTKEEIRAFKPIINSMKLIRDVCDNQESCYSCIFTNDGEHCLLRVPISWECEAAIAALDEQEEIADE